jgi:cytochrome c2
MKHAHAAIAVVLAVGLVGSHSAAASDLAEGEALYTAQCKLCHGSLDSKSGHLQSSPPLQLALLESASAPGKASDAIIAFAPPFGPNLRGVVGRPAGSVEGFTYSNTMLKTLKGMEWTEAALNVWITNPQAWVPGVYMYYKQDDPEIRRKIILYLKANP